MIAEIISQAYDEGGRKVFRPDLQHRGIHPTLPMGRYVSQPLTIKCRTIEDIRSFLMRCRYVSDKELFGKEDYWQPPEEFEQIRKGDCEDFALWTWRQFMILGYDARVVFGRHGRYGTGHAWVQFHKDGRCFLVEPQYRRIGVTFPRLSTIHYHPRLSAAWDGQNMSFYSHQDKNYRLSFGVLLPLMAEWVVGWGWYSLKVVPRLLRAIVHLLAAKLFHIRAATTRAPE